MTDDQKAIDVAQALLIQAESLAEHHDELRALSVNVANLQELARVQHGALEAMRKDLLMRSDESDSDGTKIVNCGRGVWCELNDALAKYNKLVGER